MLRVFALLISATALAACSSSTAPMPDTPLGDFRLGHSVIIADEVEQGPVSRRLSIPRIEATMERAIDARLRRFDGDGLYHIAVVISGASLAPQGIPVIFTPTSIYVMDVSVIDNATQAPLNARPKRLVVGEGVDNFVPFLGTGYTNTPEEQMANISRNAAGRIEAWLRDNSQWFVPRAGQPRLPFDATADDAVPRPAVIGAGGA